MIQVLKNCKIIVFGEDVSIDIRADMIDFNTAVAAIDSAILQIKNAFLQSSISELKLMLDDFSFKLNRDNTGDLSSFAPRFGVFNESLALPLEKLFINPKSFKGYFKPIFHRRCFMCLKRFVNLRFKR